MKRPLKVFVVGGIIAVIVVIALSTAASIFLGEPASVVATDKVAVIYIDGVIMDAKDVVDQLKKYEDDSSVKAIVLRINSPGGAVVPAQEIYREVRKLKEKTGQVVITSMGTVAASGGYYIASASDKIMANPGTLTGSIGVIMEFATAQELLNKIGIKGEVVKSGEKKDVGNFMRDMTPEERAYLQGVINDVNEQFIEAVARGRKMKVDDVRPLADGGIYTGKQAKEVGLVDQLGDLEDAITLAGKMGNIQGEPKVVTKEKKYTIFDLLSGEDVGGLIKKGLSATLNGSPVPMYLFHVGSTM
jgi:protease IV